MTPHRLNPPVHDHLTPPPLVLTVASGKGGVGKTSLVANLGIALARTGDRVCVFDADTNLANINIMLRLEPAFTLRHVLDGDKELEDILLEGPEHIRIVPAASGIADLVSLSAEQQQRLLDGLRRIEHRFDYMLIDCAAGIHETVLTFLLAAPFVVLVITSEPTSMTDAYSLLKVLRERGSKRPILVLVNRVRSRDQALEVYRRFKAAAEKYLDLPVHVLGYVLSDPLMNDSAHRQTAHVLRHPDSPAGRCIKAIARVLRERAAQLRKPERFSDLWRHLATAMEENDEADARDEFHMDRFRNLIGEMQTLIETANPDQWKTIETALADLARQCGARFGPELPIAGADVTSTHRAGDTENWGEAPTETAGLRHAITLAAKIGADQR